FSWGRRQLRINRAQVNSLQGKSERREELPWMGSQRGCNCCINGSGAHEVRQPIDRNTKQRSFRKSGPVRCPKSRICRLRLYPFLNLVAKILSPRVSWGKLAESFRKRQERRIGQCRTTDFAVQTRQFTSLFAELLDLWRHDRAGDQF